MPKFSNYLYSVDDPNLTSKVQSELPEFNFPCPAIDKLIRYTVLVYDPHADLLKLFPTDFTRRKYEAAVRAGFMLNDDDKFDPWVEDCIVGSNYAYNEAIVAFVTKFNIADLPAYVMHREAFFSEMKAAMSAKDSKEKKEAIAVAENSRKVLQDLERKLFTGDETLEIRSALYEKAERLKLQLRPEDIAKKIETGELKIKDPYYPKTKKAGRPRKNA